jgi:hypothetical protein
MRTKILAVVSAMAIVTLILPASVLAKRLTVAGSVAITKGDGTALTDELVVTAVMSNPGLEKVVTQQAPLPGPIYVFPFFIDHEPGNSGPGNLDTIAALTNTKGVAMTIKLIVRTSDGAEIAQSPFAVELAPHATKLLSLSDLME